MDTVKRIKFTAFYSRKIIGGINSNKNECSNHLVQFLNTLQVYQNSFYDHFDFELESEYEVYQKFQHLLAYGNFAMNKEEFYQGKDWHELRKYGSDLLQITGLPVYEPLDVIDFENFLEFVYDENNNLIGLN